MFGIRTPVVKKTRDDEESLDTGRSHIASAGPSVRRSIGEWEADKPKAVQPLKTPTPPKKAFTTSPPKLKSKIALSQEPKPDQQKLTQGTGDNSPVYSQPTRYNSRTSEAKACLTKAKMQLLSSRNLKKEIKDEIYKAVERLYQLVKETEAEKTSDRSGKSNKEPDNLKETEAGEETEATRLKRELLDKITDHSNQIEKNRVEMERLREVMERKQTEVQVTYASVAAGPPKRQLPEHAAVHSVVITSADEAETGDQVMDRVRKVVNAKDEGFQIDRIRKARDRKIILGCKTKNEVDRVKEKLSREGANLKIEEVKNKDPLIIIRNVNTYNTEEDILKALRTQNKNLLQGVKEEDYRAVIRYKKKARNPHQQHVVLSVSPQVWSILIAATCVHIDIQRLKAEDQSPLVQCSRCLGYGHSKKICNEEEDSCAHCGGPHLRTKCADYLAGDAPTCRNCQKAKMDHVEHNAFSPDCPIRRKWETLARSTVAYC